MAIILDTNKAQVTCYGYWPGLALIQKHSLLRNVTTQNLMRCSDFRIRFLLVHVFISGRK